MGREEKCGGTNGVGAVKSDRRWKKLSYKQKTKVRKTVNVSRQKDEGEL